MEPITRKEIYLNQIATNTGGSGGDTGLTPITREEHYFDAIVKNTASGGGGGGSSLPAVTSADNGDVLTVVNGEWDKAAPSGGGSLADLADAVIIIDNYYDDEGGEDRIEYEILKGDFASVYAKYNRGDIVVILGRENIRYPEEGWSYCGIFMVGDDSEADNELMLCDPGTQNIYSWDANGISISI